MVVVKIAFSKFFGSIMNLLGFLIFLLICGIEISEGSKAEFVTCGTILKLINTDLRLRLHSHDVKYGSGSGQQSVTAVDVSDDHNSHWLVRPAMGETCKRGVPIKCNTNIRLQHVSTKKNLHSHYFSSPLSGNQEVSCYGDDEGEGDSGDNWTVVCNNDYWRRDTPVKFRHIDTSAFLAGSGRTFGRPISGQGEIVGVTSQYGAYTDWQAKEGLFVHPSDALPNQGAVHTEL
ncbi:stromal cell-derived factor 2 [Colias croceus]|uniref:stromal cell-derived factor 2 n=1 Tax=Colias crocea TaxID=72248 RepID=UPI001E280E8E|nr:stromal cell-derived factor 2 [Colias croceus]